MSSTGVPLSRDIKVHLGRDVDGVDPKGRPQEVEFWGRPLLQQMGLLLFACLFWPLVLLYTSPKICGAAWRQLFLPTFGAWDVLSNSIAPEPLAYYWQQLMKRRWSGGSGKLAPLLLPQKQEPHGSSKPLQQQPPSQVQWSDLSGSQQAAAVCVSIPMWPLLLAYLSPRISKAIAVQVALPVWLWAIDHVFDPSLDLALFLASTSWNLVRERGLPAIQRAWVWAGDRVWRPAIDSAIDILRSSWELFFRRLLPAVQWAGSWTCDHVCVPAIDFIWNFVARSLELFNGRLLPAIVRLWSDVVVPVFNAIVSFRERYLDSIAASLLNGFRSFLVLVSDHVLRPATVLVARIIDVALATPRVCAGGVQWAWRHFEARIVLPARQAMDFTSQCLLTYVIYPTLARLRRVLVMAAEITSWAFEHIVEPLYAAACTALAPVGRLLFSVGAGVIASVGQVSASIAGLLVQVWQVLAQLFAQVGKTMSQLLAQVALLTALVTEALRGLLHIVC